MNGKIKEIKEIFKIKDYFSVRRFNEKVILIDKRQKYSIELIGLRDKIATKRHNERLKIIETRI